MSDAATNTESSDTARLRNLVAAEWIKLWSLRSTYLTLGAGTLFYLYRAWSASKSMNSSWATYVAAVGKAAFNPLHGVFGGPTWLLLMIGAGSIGAMTLAGEHATGLIRVTLTAVPARRRVALAKAALLAVVMTIAGLIIAIGSFLISQAELGSHHDGYGITQPEILRVLAACTLLVPVCALVGMGIAALVRNTAASIFLVCVAFTVLPLALRSPDSRWLGYIRNALPSYAFDRLTVLGHGGHVVDSYISSTNAAWAALAIWPIVAVLITAEVLHHRDV